jgi:PAS domain S-box-containing protein
MNSPVELDLEQQIVNLRAGDHLCLFYDKDPGEQMSALIPFIQDALRQDERFVYVADDQTVDELAERLTAGGIDVPRESDRGRLTLLTRHDWHQPSTFSTERKAQQVREVIADSERAGFNAVRFAVEMTWTLGADIGVSQLEHWEATVNTIFGPGSPHRVICQYNRSRLAPEVMLAALHTHPQAILGDRIYSNFFCEAPLILQGDASGRNGGAGARRGARARLDWMLEQLKRSGDLEKERERLMLERSELERQQVDTILAGIKQELEKEHARRRRSEESSSRLAAIVESSDDAIISKDLNGIITSWNHGAERLFGYTAEEIIGKPVLTLIPEDRHDEEPEILGRIRRGERIDHYETIRQRKDGSRVHISLTVSPVLDSAGRIVGASKIARDISDRKHAEETLRQQNEILTQMDQRKNEFLAMLGHELRNPLSAIRNAAEVLVDHGDPAAAQWATGVVRRQTALLSRLVDDLVDVARITRGCIELRRDNLEIAPIVYRAVETVRPLIAERSHSLSVTVPEETLMICADSARMEQVLVNLLTNAAKYTDLGGSISLAVSRAGEEVVVTVKDNGIGISAELLPHIFDLFVQEPRGLDRSRGGLGLGLALVRRLVKKHGGTISAQSAGPGQGSTFELRLPALQGQPSSPSAPVSAPAQTNHKISRRILIVDDNRDSALGLFRLLQVKGHDVRVAHDGDEALKLVECFAPEIFLLDLGLPGMDGYQLARELRKRGCDHALYIAISGYAQERDIQTSQQAGFHHHLAKPVEVGEITKLLAQSPPTVGDCAGKEEPKFHLSLSH